MHFTRTGRIVALSLIFAVLIGLVLIGFTKKNAPVIANRGQVRIDVPLVLVRGHQCLLTDTKEKCKQRFPVTVATPGEAPVEKAGS